MGYFKIENGIVVNAIVASAEFINTIEGTYIESQEGFGIGDTYDGTSLTKVNTGPTEEEMAINAQEDAINWRNFELEKTDSRSAVSDDPQHDAIIVYRQALRDWPSISEFPDTKPIL
jgi:hypothetical protein